MENQNTNTNWADLDRIVPRDYLDWLLFFFVIGILTISNIPGWSKVMVVYFVLLSSLFVANFCYLKLRVPPEVLVYLAWLVWALVGSVKTVDWTLYLTYIMAVIQIAIVIFVVSGIVSLNRSLPLVMFSLTIGGIIIGASVFLSGPATEVVSNGRNTGLTTNANLLAYHAIFVIFAIFYFLPIRTSIWWRSILGAMVVGVVLIVVASGSRKGFIGILAFLALWFSFCCAKQVFKRPAATVFLFCVLLGAFYFTTDYVLSNTSLGMRFDDRNLYRGTGLRVQMYLDGFNMIRENPILGVGLNNFRVSSMSGLYSHSDYIEVAATTGLIGFILYFSIYVILWRRLSRIQAMIDVPRLLYIIGLVKASIITILLVAAGRPNINSKLTWLYLAAIIGYSWSIERYLLSRDEDGNQSKSMSDSENQGPGNAEKSVNAKENGLILY